MAKKRKPGKRGGGWIRPGKRQRIYARDAYLCVWCAKDPLTRGGFTLDHLFPSGSPFRDNDPRRLVTSCWRCNAAKGQRKLSAWLREMEGNLFVDFPAVMERLRRVRDPLPVVDMPVVEVLSEEEWDAREAASREAWAAW